MFFFLSIRVFRGQSATLMFLGVCSIVISFEQYSGVDVLCLALHSCFGNRINDDVKRDTEVEISICN